jgi:hypothetical protein
MDGVRRVKDRNVRDQAFPAIELDKAPTVDLYVRAYTIFPHMMSVVRLLANAQIWKFQGLGQRLSWRRSDIEDRSGV